MKTKYFALAVSGALLGAVSFALAAEKATQVTVTNNPADQPQVSATIDAQVAVAPPAPKLSWGLDEIVKMSKAGIDESVILTFVKNSGTAYNPTAQDLIQLREQGLSTKVVNAIMDRGADIRQAVLDSQKRIEAAQAQAQSQTQAAAPTYVVQPAQPTVVYTQPVYTAPASTVTYIGYPSYNYGYYPRSYYPSYYGSYGYYGYRPGISIGLNLGSVRFGFSDSFRGGFHGGFHGGGSFHSGHHR